MLLLVPVALAASAQKTRINPLDAMVPHYQSVRNLTVPFAYQANPYVHSPLAFNENIVGTTTWDMQSSNAAPPNRTYVYEDGRMATVWMTGEGSDNNYLDRGTGYAFFDGTNWSEPQQGRIESMRTGWPSYTPSGNGELIAAHHNVEGIVFNRRDVVGQGEWQEYILANPDTNTYLSWPRLVTTGNDRMTVHMLVNTYESFNGMDGAILYYRSLDGGLTWETEARQLPGMTSAEFAGLKSETYAWAEPRGNNIAFVVADRWTDLFIMRSRDNGDTWEKITVWNHPYPKWAGQPTEPFYSPDGSASIALDNDGNVYMAFGVNRTQQIEGNPYYSWSPFIDAIAIWNEEMPVWSNAGYLTLHPDSLEASGQLAASVLDVNANGQIDLIGNTSQNLGLYYVGLSSMPQLIMDDQNQLFLIYSGIAEGFDNGTQQYRHLFARASANGGVTWGSIIDLTGESTQAGYENVFPSIAGSSGQNVHIIFQRDEEPGMSVLGDLDDPSVNSIIHLEMPKSTLVAAKADLNTTIHISQNYPNPFSRNTAFDLTLDKSSKISLKITDLTGRMVYEMPAKQYAAGSHVITVDASNLATGIYTYTFVVNDVKFSNNMIVK